MTLNFTLWPCTELHPVSCGATVQPQNLVYSVNMGAPAYRFRITGANSTSWVNDQIVIDRPIRSFTFGAHVPGFTLGTTYSVEVALGDGFGNFGPYGAPCNVSVPAAEPAVQLMSISCGATVTANDLVYAPFTGAAVYRFKIIGANTGGAGWNSNEYILDRPVRTFRFANDVPGIVLGSTYSVEVSVSYGNNVFGAFGSACNITVSNAEIHPVSCGATVDANQLVFAQNVNAAVYRFRITGANVNNEWINDELIVDRFVRSFTFSNNVPGHIPGETYTVEVATSYGNNVFSTYSTICNVTVAGVPESPIVENSDMMQNNKSSDSYPIVEVAFGANASHNPFTIDFGIQVLKANDTETINVTIYDMSGKLIERNAVNPMDIEAAKFGSNLASGMYMIEVRQGSNQTVIRQVKN